MTKEEFKKKCAELKADYESKLDNLHLDYAKGLVKHKIGDIIEDHYQKVIVEKIIFKNDLNYGLEPVYLGVLLNKNNTPRKDGKKGEIWHSNLKEV